MEAHEPESITTGTNLSGYGVTQDLAKFVLNFTSKSMMDERLDGILLVVAALLLCATGVGAFLLAEIYHVSPLWVFFAFNSGGIVVMFIKDFRGQLKRPAFVAYLVAWASAHGLLIITLTHWRVPFTLMLLGMAIELTLGLVLADCLFGIRPTPG